MNMRHILPLFVLLSVLVGACTPSDTKDNTHHDEHQEHNHNAEHDEQVAHDEGIVELHPEAAARVNIRTVVAEHRTLNAILSTTGRVDFNQDHLAHISPRIAGRVHTVHALLGQQVSVNDVLLVIDSIELGAAKSTFLKAKSQRDLTDRTRKREEGLLSDKITTQQAVLEARTAHQQARASFQAAREHLRLIGLSDPEIDGVRYNDPTAPLFSLRAPIAGTVIEKRASLGEMITPEKVPYVVADLRSLWIWVDVYERDLARVHLEDQVEVSVPAHPERTFHGMVTYIRPDVAPDTRTARARITVENPQGYLKPGMFAAVTVTDPHVTNDAAETGVVIPVSAIQRDGDTPIAFVRLDEYRYERRVLTLGRRTERFAEVHHGLSPGETVVTEGAFLLKSEAAKEEMGGGHSH